jgi:hypothetical protein
MAFLVRLIPENIDRVATWFGGAISVLATALAAAVIGMPTLR